MKIGLQEPTFNFAHQGPRLKAIAWATEGAGFHSLQMMDRFFQLAGIFGPAF